MKGKIGSGPSRSVQLLLNLGVVGLLNAFLAGDNLIDTSKADSASEFLACRAGGKIEGLPVLYVNEKHWLSHLLEGLALMNVRAGARFMVCCSRMIENMASSLSLLGIDRECDECLRCGVRPCPSGPERWRSICRG